MRLNPIDALRARVKELEEKAAVCPGEHTHTTTLDEAQMRAWLKQELIALGVIRVVTPKELVPGPEVKESDDDKR